VLVLAEIEGLTAPEIAELEGIPLGTAASRLRLARQAFQGLVASARDKNPFDTGTG
jgi:DNA-directed RNA polymerase specialized sigma24 family protein